MARFALSDGGRALFTPVRLAVALVLLLLLALFALELHPTGQALAIGSQEVQGKLRLAVVPQCDCSQCPVAAAASTAADGRLQAAGLLGAASADCPVCPEPEQPPECPQLPDPEACPEAPAAAKCPQPDACPPPKACPTAAGRQQKKRAGGKEGGDAKDPADAATTEGEYDADLLERLWQYDPFLPPRSIRRGLYSMGDPARMRRFTNKLLSGAAISMSAVGGSNTAGQGALYGKPYMTRVWDWVRQVSPTANHTLKHGAFGGSTSALFTVCVNDMVQEDADLVIVEFGANDKSDAGIFKDRDRLSYERLLRKLMEFPHKPAVVILNHYAWFVADGKEDTPANYLKNAENDFNVLGQYYGLPLLSIRAAAYHLMVNNVKGFQAKQWRVDNEDTTVEEDLYYFDYIHPQDRTGHRAMADLFISLVRETSRDLLQRQLEAEDEEIAQEPLPLPMTPGNYQRRSSTCLLQRAFQATVADQSGFVWKNERPAADMANEKWGWIGEKPGSWAELDIDSTTDMAGELKTVQNEIVLTYLKSYANMGMAKVECLAGCTCGETSFDGYWTQEASLTELHRFQATQHKHCRVRVTVLEGSSSPDGGTKVKLVGLMVVEGGGAIDAMGIQLDLFANRGNKEEAMKAG